MNRLHRRLLFVAILVVVSIAVASDSSAAQVYPPSPPGGGSVLVNGATISNPNLINSDANVDVVVCTALNTPHADCPGAGIIMVVPDVSSLPAGGTTDQTLVKDSASDGDADWLGADVRRMLVELGYTVAAGDAVILETTLPATGTRPQVYPADLVNDPEYPVIGVAASGGSGGATINVVTHGVMSADLTGIATGDRVCVSLTTPGDLVSCAVGSRNVGYALEGGASGSLYVAVEDMKEEFYALTLDELKACIENPHTVRSCRLAPGSYDAGDGFYAVLPYRGTQTQRLTIACDGSVIGGTSLVPKGQAGYEQKAVFQLGMQNVYHDSEVTIEGCRFEGSPQDTDETMLLFAQGDHTSIGNQLHRVYLRNLELGQANAFTGRGIWGYHYDGNNGAQLYMTDVAIESAGKILEWESAPLNTIAQLTNVRLLGNNGNRAANLCFNYNSDDMFSGDGLAPTPNGENNALQFSNVVMEDCGGLTVNNGAITGDLFLKNIGTATENGEFLQVLANSVTLDLTVQSVDSAVDSHGPIFYWPSGHPSFNVRVADAGCTVFNATGGTTPELFEAADGVTVDGDMRATVTTSQNGFLTCAMTPFGNELLTETYTASNSEVEAFGLITTLAGGVYEQTPGGGSVKTTGDQTIAGNKTFADDVTVGGALIIDCDPTSEDCEDMRPVEDAFSSGAAPAGEVKVRYTGSTIVLNDDADVETTLGNAASGITYDNATSGLGASQVQAAVDELAAQTLLGGVGSVVDVRNPNDSNENGTLDDPILCASVNAACSYLSTKTGWWNATASDGATTTTWTTAKYNPDVEWRTNEEFTQVVPSSAYDMLFADTTWSVVRTGTTPSPTISQNALTNLSHGHIRIQSGTDTDGQISIVKGASTPMVLTAGVRLSVGASGISVCDATNDCQIVIGFLSDRDGTGGWTTTRGAWFEYDNAVSPNWLMRNATGSAVTSATSSLSTTGAYRRLEMRFLGSAGTATITSIEFWIDGVLQSISTTNLPSPSTDAVTPIIGYRKRAGATSTSMIVEYFNMSGSPRWVP